MEGRNSNIYQESYESVCGGMYSIHPSTKFGQNVRIGENVIIDKHVEIGSNVFIGHNTVIRNGVKIGNNSTIGHLVVIESEAIIGNYSTIQSQCHITKYTIVEDHVFFGAMAMTLNTHHISHGRDFTPKLEGPVIKYGARIGSGCVIMPGVTIEREAEIGANSTVTSNCKAFWVYIGSPAKQTRPVHEAEKFKRSET